MNVIPAHRIIGRNIDMITNLLSGRSEERVIINADSKGVGRILLQNHKVEQCIKVYFTKCKGAGARKLYNTITRPFVRYQKGRSTHFSTGSKFVSAFISVI